MDCVEGSNDSGDSLCGAGQIQIFDDFEGVRNVENIQKPKRRRLGLVDFLACCIAKPFEEDSHQWPENIEEEAI